MECYIATHPAARTAKSKETLLHQDITESDCLYGFPKAPPGTDDTSHAFHMDIESIWREFSLFFYQNTQNPSSYVQHSVGYFQLKIQAQAKSTRIENF